jgi:hypothetical protein
MNKMIFFLKYSQTSRPDDPENFQLHRNHEKNLILAVLLIFEK